MHLEQQDRSNNAYILFQNPSDAYSSLLENEEIYKDCKLQIESDSNQDKNFENSIKITNLPLKVQESDIREHFKAFSK